MSQYAELVKKLRASPYMKALTAEAADALSLIEAERDEAIAETWRQIEGANRQFAVQNSIVHQITDERDKLREALVAIEDGEGDAQEIARQTLALHPTDNDHGDGR